MKPKENNTSGLNFPSASPEALFKHFIPNDKIIHQGVFSNDLKSYYYTLSDKEFNQFDVFEMNFRDEIWSDPKPAFFNSTHNEHGVSFSPDGNTIFFSSTRPKDNFTDNWNIWTCKKIDNTSWSEPTLMNIPNRKGKLISHASLADNGNIYFHSSNPDYSEMNIYKSEFHDEQYSNPEILVIPDHEAYGKCTPYIAPNEAYIVYAIIGESLDLFISFNVEGQWQTPIRLPDEINQEGQGNPSLIIHGEYLIFTVGEHIKKEWKVQWVNIGSWLSEVKIAHGLL